MGTLEATFIAKMTGKLVKIFVSVKSRMSLNLGSLGSKTRSVGQVKEIPSWRYRGQISSSIGLKICQNVCPGKISDEFEFGSAGVRN